ncbi:hypothetical protein [Nostoc sp. CALU 1950]
MLNQTTIFAFIVYSVLAVFAVFDVKARAVLFEFSKLFLAGVAGYLLK